MVEVAVMVFGITGRETAQLNALFLEDGFRADLRALLSETIGNPRGGKGRVSRNTQIEAEQEKAENCIKVLHLLADPWEDAIKTSVCISWFFQ